MKAMEVKYDSLLLRTCYPNQICHPNADDSTHTINMGIVKIIKVIKNGIEEPLPTSTIYPLPLIILLNSAQIPLTVELSLKSKPKKVQLHIKVLKLISNR